MQEGQLLYRVPLRMSLTDREELSASAEFNNTSWYVRLAAQLLRERQDPSSAWQPYLQVPEQHSAITLSYLHSCCKNTSMLTRAIGRPFLRGL